MATWKRDVKKKPALHLRPRQKNSAKNDFKPDYILKIYRLAEHLSRIVVH